MDMNWALDVQSAQTLDFYAAMHGGKVAWDLGTLTGISAAVLSAHMKKVTRRADVFRWNRIARMGLNSSVLRIVLLALIVRSCVWHSKFRRWESNAQSFRFFQQVPWIVDAHLAIAAGLLTVCSTLRGEQSRCFARIFEESC